MADETGHAILLVMGPAGYIVTEAAAETEGGQEGQGAAADADEWATTAGPRAPRMSHSGNAAALLAAAGGTSGAAAAAVTPDHSSTLPVVDAADYGAYSYGAAAAAGVGVAAAAAASAADRDVCTNTTQMVEQHSAAAAAVTRGDDEDTTDTGFMRDQQSAAAAGGAEAGGVYSTSMPVHPATDPRSPTAWMASSDTTTATTAPTGVDLYSTATTTNGVVDDVVSNESTAAKATAAPAAPARAAHSSTHYEPVAPHLQAGDAEGGHHLADVAVEGDDADDSAQQPVGKIRLSAQGVALTASANGHY